MAMTLAERVAARKKAKEEAAAAESPVTVEETPKDEPKETVAERQAAGKQKGANPPDVVDVDSPKVEEPSKPAKNTKPSKPTRTTKPKKDPAPSVGVGGGGYTLLVDCRADGLASTAAADIVAEVGNEIAKQNGAEHWAQLDGAHWTDARSMLEAKVDLVLKSGTITGFVVIDSRNYYWSIVGHLFQQHADQIIRGFVA